MRKKEREQEYIRLMDRIEANESKGRSLGATPCIKGHDDYSDGCEHCAEKKAAVQALAKEWSALIIERERMNRIR